MYQDAFKKLKKTDLQKTLKRVNPHLDHVEFDPGTTAILAQDISFYPGYRFLEITDNSSVPACTRFVIDGGEQIHVLDWTPSPIYALNETVPLMLSEDNVDDYVRFFLKYVRGTKGLILLAENVDDIEWKDDPPPPARKAIGKMLVPVNVIEKKKDSSFVLEVTAMMKDSLFKVHALVSETGILSFQNEEILVEDMPVLDDVFMQ